MNLQDFVRETLVQITLAVDEANKVFKEKKSSAEANPFTDGNAEAMSNFHRVKFDVAVTAESESNISGGAGLKVVGIGIGTESKAKATETMASRVQFEIPLKLPQS